MDWRDSIRRGCRVIQTLPAPQGRVTANSNNFIRNQGFAQMVKYVARHVSIDLPEGMVHDLEDGQVHQFLKGELERLDPAIRLPPFFAHMVTSLIAFEFIHLPPPLYQAAFAREFHDTPLHFAMHLNDPRYMEEIQYFLLRGAGYRMQWDVRVHHGAEN